MNKDLSKYIAKYDLVRLLDNRNLPFNPKTYNYMSDYNIEVISKYTAEDGYSHVIKLHDKVVQVKDLPYEQKSHVITALIKAQNNILVEIKQQVVSSLNLSDKDNSSTGE